jgi:kynurenine 3-monooxygenase
MTTRAEAEPIVMVGAGLVGSLLAIFLARRGMQVRLFERLPDMRRTAIPAGRSINLAISERGLASLRRVGLEAQARSHAIPMRGRMLHPVTGELGFQAYGKDDSQCINSISRGWLNQMLMTAAEATGRVDIHFDRRLTGIDWSARHLTFDIAASPPAGEGEGVRGAGAAPPSQREPFSVLIGTDGGGSAVRGEMVKLPGYEISQELLADGYKELLLPAGPGGTFQLEKHALHIWPRGSHMLIALPNEDGSFTCTLFLPFRGPVSFEALQSPRDVAAFFEREFPDARKLLPDLEQQFFANPTGFMGTVKISPWDVPGKALLVGDAAHAIVPFFGQGMNCGFEDCLWLDRLLERHSLAESFESFGRLRKEHSDAIADMAVENFVEMRDRTADPRFLLEKQIEKILLNAFPGEFLSRYTLVSFSLVPYRFAYRVGEIASGIVSELSKGLAKAEDVDLGKAGRLIRERLVPYLEENGYESRT